MACTIALSVVPQARPIVSPWCTVRARYDAAAAPICRRTRSALVPGSIATTRTTSSPYRSSSRDSRSIRSPRGGEMVIWTIP
jgi:hypothetical protein